MFSLESSSLFSLTLTLFFPSSSWDKQLPIPSLSFPSTSDSVFSLCLEHSFLITRYAVTAHMPFWPLMDLFSINKFLSLTEANDVLQIELGLTNDVSNFCSKKYKFPVDKISFPDAFSHL